MKKIVIIGPAHPLRGGLATFNQRLAKEFIDQGYDCTIYSFSLQYPDFMFPGTTQYSDQPAPINIPIRTVINSINPLNWFKVGKELKQLKPDLVIVRYWLPLMGPALGTILRCVRRNNHSKIIAITDNVVPHEKRLGDIPFTKYFLKACDGFVTMSEKVMNDLKQFITSKPAQQLHHPLYDNFGEILPKQEARAHLNLPANGRIVLFFGFIRKYKGLDLLFDALKIMKDRDPNTVPTLLVAGEFYENQEPYLEQIKRLGIEKEVILRTNFIPDNEVKYYLCSADAVIQPYRNATQSGVTPLAYHFERPMVVTNVGGLPALVPHGKVGLVTSPEPAAIAAGIQQFYELGEDFFYPHLRTEKQQYSWSKFVLAILSMAESIHPGKV
jgi:glycosyltransferase involved in cell wall biosynthesis